MDVLSPQSGDVGLSRGTGRIDWAIRFCESRRYGRHSTEAYFNHAFLVVDPAGVVEARGEGIVSRPLSDYDTTAHVIYRPGYLASDERLAAIIFGQGRLGRKYGTLQIASLALGLMTQTKLRFGMDGRYICSGLVGAALDHAGLDMPDDPEWCTPADLEHVAKAQSWAVVHRHEMA